MTKSHIMTKKLVVSGQTLRVAPGQRTRWSIHTYNPAHNRYIFGPCNSETIFSTGKKRVHLSLS